MNQTKQNSVNDHAGQFQYLGRWVDKATFRAYVYNAEGQEKLANNYDQYESLTSGGLWFASKDAAVAPVVSKVVPVAVSEPKGKPKDGSIRSNS